jgi:UDP-N-acetylglucosamine 3-dehydrogenase
MSGAFKIVLVGLGRMGRNHFRILKDTPGLELVAAVDATAAPPPDLGSVQFHRSLDDLAKVTFDAAVIATPTATHHEVALRVIEMGKHLLIEKPIASSFEQSREVLAAAERKGVRVAVGHVERFNPAVRKLREVIREGWLGTPIHLAFTRVGGYPDTVLSGNNVLLDLAVHDIDVFRSVVGGVKLEHAMSHATFREGVFDTAEIFLASAMGPSASVHVNWITPTKIRSIRVTGTRGVCFVDYILQSCELMGGSLLKKIEPETPSFELLQELYRATDRIQFGVQKLEPLRAQAMAFREFLATGTGGELCLGRDASAAVLLAERAMAVGGQRATRPGAAPAALAERPPSEADEWV